MNKPRRRKQGSFPWRKIAAVVIAVVLAGAASWYIYETYIYKPPPVYARIETSLGSFEVELYPVCAPATVANFVSLANSGFYDNLVWHRILKGFVIQTGDPNTRADTNSSRATWGQGGSPTTIPNEANRCSWLTNYNGTLGMARQGNGTYGLDTATSQFYVNLSNNTVLDTLNYAVFGKVIANMSVVLAIGNSPVCKSPACPSDWPAGEPYPSVFVTNIVILTGP